MMLKTILFFVLLASTPQADTFRKEMLPLQQSIDTTVGGVVARVLQPSKATYLDGYGIVVTLEVALTAPRTPFSSPASSAESKAAVALKLRELQLKMPILVTQKVAAFQSLAPAESFAVVIHILNTNPADVVDLPSQVVFSAKKETPEAVITREF